jgi:phosphoribosylglycinamide formyltransferase-1
VPVRAEDTEAALAARVLKQEHSIYPLAIRWFVEDRLVVENGLVRVNGAEARQSIVAEE